MAYVISILNCMAHRSLSWSTSHEATYGFTLDVTHLMKFEFWEPIIILDNKTQFTESHNIFGYYDVTAPNKGAHGLLASSVPCHTTILSDPN